MANKSTAIPEDKITGVNLDNKSNVSAHATYHNCKDMRDPSNPTAIIVKKNKYDGIYGKEGSELEVVFGGLAGLMMRPGLTTTQNIMINAEGAVTGVTSQNISHQITEEIKQGKKICKLKDAKNNNIPISEWAEITQVDDPACGFTFLHEAPFSFDVLMVLDRQGVVILDMDSLACILTTSYLLEEDDLHKANLGYYVTMEKNAQGKFIPKITFFKIDHDLMFADSLMSWRDMRKTSFYYNQDSFKMTPNDFKRFPDLEDSGNHYWPTRYSMMTQGTKAYHNKAERAAFVSLKKNDAFKAAKWRYFLKYSLMPNHLIQASMAHHLDAVDDTVLLTMVKTTMDERSAKFRQTLASVNGFKRFLTKKTQAGLIDTIIEEIKQELLQNSLNSRDNPNWTEAEINAEKQLISEQVEASWAAMRDAVKPEWKKKPLCRDILLNAYLFTDMPEIDLNGLDDALQLANTKFKMLSPQSVAAFEQACIIIHLIEQRPKNNRNEYRVMKRAALRCKQAYLQSDQITTFKQFTLAVDKLRQAKIPLKQHKNEVILLLKASKKLTDPQELMQLKTGLSRSGIDPSLKFIRQLRSGLWIVRLIRSFFEGAYGYTSTVSNLLITIDGIKPRKMTGPFFPGTQDSRPAIDPGQVSGKKRRGLD